VIVQVVAGLAGGFIGIAGTLFVMWLIDPRR
jgi:hypothetical protein